MTVIQRHTSRRLTLMESIHLIHTPALPMHSLKCAYLLLCSRDCGLSALAHSVPQFQAPPFCIHSHFPSPSQPWAATPLRLRGVPSRVFYERVCRVCSSGPALCVCAVREFRHRQSPMSTQLLDPLQACCPPPPLFHCRRLGFWISGLDALLMPGCST